MQQDIQYKDSLMRSGLVAANQNNHIMHNINIDETIKYLQERKEKLNKFDFCPPIQQQYEQVMQNPEEYNRLLNKQWGTINPNNQNKSIFTNQPKVGFNQKNVEIVRGNNFDQWSYSDQAYKQLNPQSRQEALDKIQLACFPRLVGLVNTYLVLDEHKEEIQIKEQKIEKLQKKTKSKSKQKKQKEKSPKKKKGEQVIQEKQVTKQNIDEIDNSKDISDSKRFENIPINKLQSDQSFSYNNTVSIQLENSDQQK